MILLYIVICMTKYVLHGYNLNDNKYVHSIIYEILVAEQKAMYEFCFM